MPQPIDNPWPREQATGTANGEHTSTPAVTWADDVFLLITGNAEYELSPGHLARSLCCAACGYLIGSARVIVHVAVTQELCTSANNHLRAYAILTHADCDTSDDGELSRDVRAAIGTCLSDD